MQTTHSLGEFTGGCKYFCKCLTDNLIFIVATIGYVPCVYIYIYIYRVDKKTNPEFELIFLNKY